MFDFSVRFKYNWTQPPQSSQLKTHNLFWEIGTAPLVQPFYLTFFQFSFLLWLWDVYCGLPKWQNQSAVVFLHRYRCSGFSVYCLKCVPPAVAMPNMVLQYIYQFCPGALKSTGAFYYATTLVHAHICLRRSGQRTGQLRRVLEVWIPAVLFFV